MDIKSEVVELLIRHIHAAILLYSLIYCDPNVVQFLLEYFEDFPKEYSMAIILIHPNSFPFLISKVKNSKPHTGLQIIVTTICLIRTRTHRYECLEILRENLPTILHVNLCKLIFLVSNYERDTLILHCMSGKFCDDDIFKKNDSVLVNNPSSTQVQVIKEYLKSVKSRLSKKHFARLAEIVQSDKSRNLRPLESVDR